MSTPPVVVTGKKCVSEALGTVPGTWWRKAGLSRVTSVLCVNKLTRACKAALYLVERSFCGQRVRNQTLSQATQCLMVTQWSLLECTAETHSVLLWEPSTSWLCVPGHWAAVEPGRRLIE